MLGKFGREIINFGVQVVTDEFQERTGITAPTRPSAGGTLATLLRRASAANGGGASWNGGGAHGHGDLRFQANVARIRNQNNVAADDEDDLFEARDRWRNMSVWREAAFLPAPSKSCVYRSMLAERCANGIMRRYMSSPVLAHSTIFYVLAKREIEEMRDRVYALTESEAQAELLARANVTAMMTHAPFRNA